MAYALSLLDKSPLSKGESATDALKRTVALAQLAERLGYRRFWVAEHHNVAELASSSPEIVIAHLLALTSRIRVGSGGVMLQHYSAYKVAENFNLLASLAPDRVDLGIGKAPGGLPLSTKALQGDRDPARKPDFGRQVAELGAYLDGAGPVAGLSATPRPSTAPQRFLLGASVESAELAAAHGWDFVFARHLNGDDALLDDAVAAYRAATGRAPIIAVSVIVSDYVGEAEAEAAKIKLFKVHVPGAQSVTVGNEEQAKDYARQLGSSEYRIEPKQPSVIAGTPDQVRAELDRLHARSGAVEFIVEPAVSGSWRLATVEALVRQQPAAAA
ncbi:MsnO8 family LLM class oxidoreductase [Mesorhizobium sp. CU2]|uniref:MsnO8 family LLM class oxidoreductase n=1 Tax=unclassified Mesorhizobium TaxID=325217 RepID=UPI00112CEBC8|nr:MULTISPECIES: MsnO8 family LLM class oxidoreductase [unclassified Mesorhizobium]TPN80487.1 MsnO8 family LLM class oxidoreductase [Mesorhizobium sp. CU3]TPO11951.1 MsnO8 family LLM class oxidoreductase [Mesorhizobium sp. CU2]